MTCKKINAAATQISVAATPLHKPPLMPCTDLGLKATPVQRNQCHSGHYHVPVQQAMLPHHAIKPAPTGCSTPLDPHGTRKAFHDLNVCPRRSNMAAGPASDCCESLSTEAEVQAKLVV